MKRIKQVLMSVAALAALALGGAAIANATSGGGERNGTDQPDQAVTGTTAQRAGDAAQKAVGGGRVVSVERSDEDGSTYEVKVDDGKVHEVQVDSSYTVTANKLDDDQHEQQSGADDHADGETNDD